MGNVYYGNFERSPTLVSVAAADLNGLPCARVSLDTAGQALTVWLSLEQARDLAAALVETVEDIEG